MPSPGTKDAPTDVRPLGWLALGLALVGLLLTLSVVLSPVAVLPAGLAVALGLAARSEPATRRTGPAAVVIGALSIIGAVAVFLLVLMDDGFGY